MAVQVSEHDKKFDRQMRLWGGHGQRALEEATICVLGAGPCASESLKNLVLPNVGTFTLVDGEKVKVSDLGNNFFITQDNVGKSRAAAVAENLMEMNPDVKVSGIEKNPSDLIANDLAFFDKFTIVIATQLYGELHTKLAAYCREKNIPYINARINGMLATVRLDVKEIAVMESHPTDDRTDFYIYPQQLKNFKELQDYIDSFDIETRDVEGRAHLPCIALLGQYTQQWMAKHDGKLPGSYKEQVEFKDNVREWSDGENVDDAVLWAFQCYNEPRVHQSVRRVLADVAGEKLSAESSEFWILVRALRDFMENEGAGFLPVSQSIPDITTDPKSYVALKNIYKARFEKDKATITKYVQKRLTELKRAADSISDVVIDRFVRNCRNLKVVRTKSVADEIANPDMNHLEELYEDEFVMPSEDGAEEEEVFKPKQVNWYWAFRALDVFYDKNKRVAGDTDATVESDAEQLVAIQEELFKTANLKQEIEKACLKELSRFGGAEIHNTAAFVGGVVSQVVMKVILRQFFPYNHTFLYDGIFCSAAVFTV